MRWNPKTGNLDRHAGFPRVAFQRLILSNLVTLYFKYPTHSALTMKLPGDSNLFTRFNKADHTRQEVWG
jgi:hypothetical protein